MKHNSYTLCAIIGILIFTLNCKAQITRLEADHLKSSSINLVENLYTALNIIGDKNTPSLERKLIVNNALEQLFYNNEVIVEDDLLPAREEERNTKINEYLTNAHLFYYEDGVQFKLKNVAVSEVYKGDYLFTIVSFERTLNGRSAYLNMDLTNTYPRTAEVRCDKINGDWEVKIVSLNFEQAQGKYKKAEILDVIAEVEKDNDESYWVISSALYSLNNIDSVAALQKAESLIKEPNLIVQDAVASILTASTDIKHNAYFKNYCEAATGIRRFSGVRNYGIYLKNINDEKTIIDATDYLKKSAINKKNKWVRYYSAEAIYNKRNALMDQQNNLATDGDLTKAPAGLSKKKIESLIGKLQNHLLQIKNKETDETILSSYKDFIEETKTTFWKNIKYKFQNSKFKTKKA